MLAWDPQLSCGTRNDSCVLSSVCSNSDKCSDMEREKYIYYISFACYCLSEPGQLILFSCSSWAWLFHGVTSSSCYSQTLFFPNLLIIHSYIWLTCWTLFLCVPPSLLVPLPPPFSLCGFLVYSFLCFYIFSLLLCAMHLFSPPCLHPGYLLLHPVPSICLPRMAGPWWWDVVYTTSQLLRWLSGSLQVPLGRLRE